MSTTRPLRVFICHSSNDKPVVRELYQKLRAETWIQPWLDEEELYPGQDWNFEIEKAVEAADVILVCLSKGSTTKEGYVQREIRIALDYADYKPEGTLYVIPVRLEECDPPRRLRVWQYADYFEGQRERGLQRLLVSLKRRADALGLKFEEPTPKIQEKPVEEKKPVIETPKSVPVATPPNKITLSNGMELMRVPAGTFLMGSTKENKLADADERPQHTVDIPYDYFMARFPVTSELYNAYAQSKGIKHPVDGWGNKKDHPVVNISWNDAMEYCIWLNDLLKGELPSDLVLRLATEAEWEKAARWLPSPRGRGAEGEGESLEYPWGDKFNKNKCNTNEGGKARTTPVSSYSPGGDSPYGCADMVGNVWEWTHSLKKEYPYNASDGRENEKASGNRVLRGGSFFDNEWIARCAYRSDYLRFGDFLSYVGLRVVASLPESSATAVTMEENGFLDWLNEALGG